MSIKAIETRYAGHRFRSRLEARWAVFFDTLGWEWQYEPQGFECEWRLDRSEKSLLYLPDFYLPRWGVYAEVKGSLDEQETWRLLNAAAHLSAPDGGCGSGSDLVVLGNVPSPGRFTFPVCLHMHKGDLEASAWHAEDRHQGNAWASDAPDIRFSLDAMSRILLEGLICRWAHSEPVYAFDIGYTAARSARFEHGERG